MEDNGRDCVCLLWKNGKNLLECGVTVREGQAVSECLLFQSSHKLGIRMMVEIMEE